MPNFEDIQTAHSEFLDTCIRGCFLDVTSKRFIGNTLKQALATCDRFYGVIHQAASELDFSDEGAAQSEVVRDIQQMLEVSCEGTYYPEKMLNCVLYGALGV
jgi:hypothetical protein